MKPPHKHGILKRNLRVPANEKRIFVALRNLRPKIKKQAIHHHDHCQNQDTDAKVMKNCKCHKIK